MIEVPVMDMKGQRLGSEQIDPKALGGTVRVQLLKQAVVAYRAAQRMGTVKHKSRAEVHGAGRKLYRQKGTGNARAGNLRTPVRRGGGRTFARVPSDWSVELPRRMRRLARDSAILSKLQAGQALILDSIRFDTPKTKQFQAMLKALDAERGCVLAVAARDVNVWRAGRNIPTVDIKPVQELNAYDILRRRKLVIVRDAFRTLGAAGA